VLAQASVASLIIAILGVIAMTGEFGHQTATPTFLATPRRGRVVLAKLLTYAVVGLGYASACTGLVLAVALPWLAAKGVSYSLTASDTARSLAGVGAQVAIYAVFGVAVGALVRNQIAAVVGLVVYLFVVGPILSGIPATSQAAKFQPWQAGNALARLQPSENAVMLPQLYGGLVLIGWAVLLAALGTRLAVRRDIT
jgi:ABC-2 type transport system permease protein